MINGSIARQKSTRQTFYDRREAGRLLATLLRKFAERYDVVVLGLPRGGEPVAFEVAVAIGAQLDVFTVRKLGVPGHEEFAMGAIGNDGTYILIEETIEAFGIRHDEIVRVAQREACELDRRERLYRDHRPYPLLEGKNVIVIDDGRLATRCVNVGRGKRAAAKAAGEDRRRGPGRVDRSPIFAPRTGR